MKSLLFQKKTIFALVEFFQIMKSAHVFKKKKVDFTVELRTLDLNLQVPSSKLELGALNLQVLSSEVKVRIGLTIFVLKFVTGETNER